MLNKEPYGSKIIVLALEAEEVRSAGGLILDGESIPIGVEGIVEAAGPSCTQARVGRIVTYPANAGFELFIKGKKYRMMQEYDAMYFDDLETDIPKYEDRVFNEKSAINNE